MSSNSTKTEDPPKKIVIRRLPPTLTKEQFIEIVSPLPEYDFFYYCKADLGLGPYAHSRAYVSFKNLDDVFIFKEKFDNYVFVDAKSNEYPAIVEFAPYQRKLRNQTQATKKDSKINTIEQDTDYQKFVENLDKKSDQEPQLPSCESILVEIENREKEIINNGGQIKQTTPLLEFLKKKREDKKQTREKERELRKKRDDERRKRREEEEKQRSKYTQSNIKIMTKPATTTSANNDKPSSSNTKSSSNSSSNNNSGSSSNRKSTTTTLKSSTLTITSTITVPATTTNKSKEGANSASNSTPKPSTPTTGATNSSASAASASTDSKDDNKEKVKNKDRPSIEIYNPAQRAALRRQQQQKPSKE